MNTRIVVIGSSNADRIMRLPHLPAVGETVSDGVFAQAFGGKGANQAVAAARASVACEAGGNVVFISAVGADAEGDAMRESFARDGIDTSRMIVSPNLPTGAALIMIGADGSNYLAVAPGANYALRPDDIRANHDVIETVPKTHHPGYIQAHGMIVLQNEIPAETANYVIETAGLACVPVLLNYAPVRDKGITLSNRVSYLVVNENEASELVGSPVDTPQTAFAACEKLIADYGIGSVIVTLGANGLVVVNDNGLREYIPAFPVKAVDTTAAGDTFCGALAVAIVEGKPLLEACRWASAASALSVTVAGAQPSIPNRAAIEAFLSQNPANGRSTPDT